MASSFFFLQTEKKETNSKFIEALESYADQTKQQVYVIDRPLADSKYTYSYEDKLIVLCPGHKILLLDYGTDPDRFDEFVDDLIEDLASISDKFRYKTIIGRARHWRDDLIAIQKYDTSHLDIQNLFSMLQIKDNKNKKSGELLISLLTGSINDIEKVKDDVPDNVLDKIKQKIILFDGDQTRFIYQKPSKKQVTIQGLSGTGKTELLLHKLRDIYTDSKGSKMMFTCHNKVLADSLRNRIPEFFNFMRVEEQIRWNKRLWCVNAWGSQGNRDSGAYSYICDYYNLPFFRYSLTTNFNSVCKKALEYLIDIDIDQVGYAFDYMLIDESQDFPNSFFELCSKVTNNTVYIAGDIFQSIFEDTIIREINPDYLLSKCYRTDPRTLMFAHAIGMGLFESPKLRWLEDREWRACGYIVSKADRGRRYTLTREPLRRFEDLEEEGVNSVDIVKIVRERDENVEMKIIEILRGIISRYPTVLPDDIGIIFIDSVKSTYLSADKLEQSIPREFGWRVNKAYETKESVKGKLFVSNRNNVKGLEFPFVICVTNRISNSRNYRNALYMMLTRSFIKSYLLTSLDNNEDLIERLESGLQTINSEGCLKVTAPSEEEKKQIKTTIDYRETSISYYDFVYGIFNDLDIPAEMRSKLYDAVKIVVGEDFDYDNVREFVEFNFKKMSK